MSEANFLGYLVKQVERLKKRWKLSEGAALGMWFAAASLELDEDDAYACVSYDGGNDKDIDLFYIDEEAERVIIGQTKYNRNGRYKGDKNELLALIDSKSWLKDPEALARDGRRDLATAAEEYVRATSSGYSVEYVYVFMGPENRELIDKARQFNVEEAGSTPSRYCRVANLADLETIHNENIGKGTRVSTTVIPLKKKYMYEQEGEFGEALVTTLNGKVLWELYEQFSDQLFDRNVRLFLGARKSGVNAGLRDTLDSTSDRKNFWAYNNGVTFICDRFELKKNSLTLHNFSIVNGCQTTVSISNAPKRTAADIVVLARFIAAPEEKIIDSIIRYTNSQNPIRPWDLNAQDKLQKKLKAQLAALAKPYLYQLRKGEINQLTLDEKDRFRRDNRLQVIRHDLCAQYIAAFKGLPAIAYKDKGKIFLTHKDEIFPTQLRAEEVVLIWQAAQVASSLVKSELKQAASENKLDRLSVLKRGGKFFLLAVMSILLHERNGRTFLNKLSAETASSKKTLRRLVNYSVVALEWYIEAMNELVATGTDVSTLVRNQDTWKLIKNKSESKWKVYCLARKQVDEALPKL